MVFRPDTFGKYVLLKRIAVGGMAEVFRAKAFGAEGFEKLVAIKRMLPHLSSDQQFVGMFINEAKLTASLNHANIAQIYDFGCIDNLYFLSMEYVFGKDLADLIRIMRDRGLVAPVELACHVIIEALNGLDYAHRRVDAYGNSLNLVHRDTSPHNLILSYEGEVKIVDFGIAKAKSTTVQTTGGVLKGKYSYMSPEQAHGMALDHRTDIFSLGICFYELLTLTKMFQGASDLSVLEKVRETNFVPPREINEDIPAELEQLLLKALEKNPEDRWSSAAEWREAIEDFLYRANLHYSTAWLSGFMREIFREDVEREATELAEEAEVAKQLRTNARRVARMEVIRDTVVLKRGEDGSFSPAEGTEQRPPIREVPTDEYDLEEPEPPKQPPFLDTTREATPLGQRREEQHARGQIGVAGDLDDLDELDDLEEVSEEDVIVETLEAGPEDIVELPPMDPLEDDSLPTMEVSRPAPVGNRIPPRAAPIREIETDDEDVDDEDDDDEDVTEAETLDERHQPGVPPPPIQSDEDFAQTRPLPDGRTGETALDPSEFDDESITFKQRRAKPRGPRGELPVEESTARSGAKRFGRVAFVLVLVAALGAGGAVALWPLIGGNDNNSSGLDAGLAATGPAAEPVQPPDAGIGVMQPMGPDFDAPKDEPVDAGALAQADADSPAGPGGADADAEKVAAVVEPKAEPDLDPPAPKAKPKPKPKPKPHSTRRRSRRRRTPSCSTRGTGTVDVGVSGGWAFVYIDGRKVRTTPLINYQVKAGKRRIELRDGGNKLIRRWDICLRNGRKVKLLHQ